MSPASHTLFPNAGLQVLSAFIHLFGVTILTYFLSLRLSAEKLNSREAWARISWARLCILLVFLDSYLFMFSAGLLIFGVGLSRDSMSCGAGILICVAFYATSKVLIYAFLTEKVYMVWENGLRRRFKSPVYLVCIGTVALYIGVVASMIYGRIAEIRFGDGACVIGLKPMASLPLLSYDLYINVLLTCLFLWPLMRAKFVNPRLRRVATRTLVASLAALTTSTVNIAVLTILHGRELGWLCLASCASDVVFNAAALFWVTSGLPDSSVSTEGSLRPASLQFPLRPFSLRPKYLSPRPPTQFQIHVTTTSEMDMRPPTRERETDCESSVHEKDGDELQQDQPAMPHEEEENEKAEMPAELSYEEVMEIGVSKRRSDGSEKTLTV